MCIIPNIIYLYLKLVGFQNVENGNIGISLLQNKLIEEMKTNIGK